MSTKLNLFYLAVIGQTVGMKSSKSVQLNETTIKLATKSKFLRAKFLRAKFLRAKAVQTGLNKILREFEQMDENG
jgi:hypothetical protein